MEFNPNKPAIRKEFIWATFFPDRNPKFKMYSQRGHALSSFQYRENGILYRWVNDEWKEVFRLENYDPLHIKTCDKCGKVHEKHYSVKKSWITNDPDKIKLTHVCYRGCLTSDPYLC